MRFVDEKKKSDCWISVKPIKKPVSTFSCSVVVTRVMKQNKQKNKMKKRGGEKK